MSSPNQNETIKIVSYTTKNPDRRAELRNGVAALGRDRKLEIVFVDDEDSAVTAMADAEILFTWTISPEMFAVANKLKWVHISGAGVETNLYPAFRDSSVLLTNARGIHGPQIAEWTLGALLYIGQQFSLADGWRRDHDWRAAKEPMTRSRFLIADKSVLIVGYGHIGKAIAETLTVNGMRCEAVSSTSRDEAIPVYASNQLSAIIGNYDIVIISLPLTAQTRGLFDSELLSRMKQNSILVNISRGKIIQEPAIIHALQHGPLAYAALDVFATEPLPPDSPLFDLPNLFMTPHISGNFPSYTKLAIESFLENLRRYIAGVPLLNPVDKQRGY